MAKSNDPKLTKNIQVMNIQNILKEHYNVKLSRQMISNVYDALFQFINTAVSSKYQVITPVGSFRALEVPERTCSIPNQPGSSFVKPAHRRPNLKCSQSFKRNVMYGLNKETETENTTETTTVEKAVVE